MQHAHFRAPRLGGGDKLSPTARGTATHMLLQYIDYEKTGTEQEIREELARLTAARFLSPRQAEASIPAAYCACFPRRSAGA